MRRPILDELKKAIEASSKKDSTKKAYLSRVATLERAASFPFKGKQEQEELFRELNPKGNLSSEYNITAALLSFSKLLPAFAKLLTKPTIARLRVKFERLGEQKKELQSQTRPTDISWDEVQSIDPSHGNKTDRLIWALYTQLPPIRNDYVDVKLVDSEADATDPSINYFIRDSSKFVIKNHKTSGRYGDLEIDVPPHVAKLIPHHQTWLFEKDEVPLKDNTQNKRINQALERISGRKMTIISLRRSYAAHMKDTMTEEERIAESHKMGHSGTTNKLYAH